MAKVKLGREQFPAKLFVYKDPDGYRMYYIANETERECASLDENRIIGVYELKEVGEIRANVVRVPKQ
jgi:hypothetical protein